MILQLYGLVKNVAPPPFKNWIYVSEDFLVPKLSDIGYLQAIGNRSR